MQILKLSLVWSSKIAENEKYKMKWMLFSVWFGLAWLLHIFLTCNGNKLQIRYYVRIELRIKTKLWWGSRCGGARSRMPN